MNSKNTTTTSTTATPTSAATSQEIPHPGSSTQEVQTWLCSYKEGKFIDNFDGINGKELLEFKIEDLVAICGTQAAGRALFNTLHPQSTQQDSKINKYKQRSVELEQKVNKLKKRLREQESTDFEKMKKKQTIEQIIIIKDNGTFQRFTFSRMLGVGRRSLVFVAKDISDRKVCIKVEPIDDCEQIDNEVAILKCLRGCDGVPKLIFHGTTFLQSKHWQAIVTNIVGEPINSCSVVFRLDFVNEALNILKQIHRRKIVHNDIKPSHLIISNNKLYLIDYGCAGKIGHPSKFGTRKFTSTLAHIGFNNEKSDIESLWFSFLSLFTELPWDKPMSDLELFRIKMQFQPQEKEKEFPQLAPVFIDLLQGKE